MHIKISSLNLSGYNKWDERKSKILSYIDDEDMDILFLQEVQYDTKYSHYSQSEYINLQLKQQFPYIQSDISLHCQPRVGTAYREGLAILSKFPITRSEVLVLSKQPDDRHSRIIQNIDLSINHRTVGFTNIHLSNNVHSVEQLTEVLKLIETRGEKRTILGDYNIFDIEKVHELYSTKYTASSEFKRYISFPSENVTLDYILLPKDLAFVALETTTGLSDHNSLTATLDIGQ